LNTKKNPPGRPARRNTCRVYNRVRKKKRQPGRDFHKRGTRKRKKIYALKGLRLYPARERGRVASEHWSGCAADESRLVEDGAAKHFRGAG